MLNLAKYNELFNQFDWETYIRQCNYYYDSKSFWANTHGYTVRVRKIEDNIILQIKSPNTSKEAYKSRTEYGMEISRIPEYLYTADLVSIKDDTSRPERLEMLGYLETERYTKHLTDDIVLFLDRNQYCGFVDYEVEVEFSKDSGTAEKFLLGLGLEPHKIPGKYTRFVMQFTNVEDNK